ncbi:MAG: phytanoyl-CoA dioxygenase family protein, partial [Microthrixaceae bacterium]
SVNRRVDETIRRLFAEPAEQVFDRARLGGASFLVKGTGPDSASTPHQDWNNVEEDQTLSLSIWVPLVDVDESNGALQVIPGSHRCRPSVRSLDTPSLYLDFTDELEPHLRAVPARAGEAVLYAHNLFHGSRPNRSEEIRVSAVAGVTHEHSRLVHYRRAAGCAPDTFDVFEVESDFYFSGIPDMTAGRIPPTARPAGRVEVPHHQLELADVLAAAVATTSSTPEERP